MFVDFIRRLMGKVPGFDGMDRRQTLRARCDFEVDVSCGNLRYLARVLDASPRGMRMRIRGPWKPSVVKKGKAASLKYLVPMVGVEQETVQCQVRWAKKEAPNLFLLAVIFDEPTEKLQKSWVKPVLLKALRQKVAQQRKSLRVRCRLAARLQVEGKAFEASIHDLSLQGARIESFQAFSEGTPLVLEANHESLGPLKLNATVKRILKPFGTFTYGLKLHPEGEGSTQLLAYIRHFQAVNKRNEL